MERSDTYALIWWGLIIFKERFFSIYPTGRINTIESWKLQPDGSSQDSSSSVMILTVSRYVGRVCFLLLPLFLNNPLISVILWKIYVRSYCCQSEISFNFWTASSSLEIRVPLAIFFLKPVVTVLPKIGNLWYECSSSTR